MSIRIFPSSSRGTDRGTIKDRLRSLSQAQRRLLETKVHVNPGMNYHLPETAPFVTSWGAGIFLVSQLGRLPAPLLAWWASQKAGHILITDGEAGYVAGGLSLGDRTLFGVTQVPLALLLSDETSAVGQALFCLDHLLGCLGEETGLWLSQSGGITPAWQEIGRQIHVLFALGYGLSHAAREDSRLYLAQGLAISLMDRRHLNTDDPKLDRLLGASLFNPGFCRNHLSSES